MLSRDLNQLALTCWLIVTGCPTLALANPLDFPRISISDIDKTFIGAFKVEHRSQADIDDPSESLNTGYANGRIAYRAKSESVFIDSHVYADAVGEFKIPQKLSTSANPANLPNATLIQDFEPLLDKPTLTSSEDINSLGGMAVIKEELFVQAYRYYDAPAKGEQTTLVVRDSQNLPDSRVDGFFKLQGAAKTVSYLSPIPKAWQSTLQGDYLAGNGGGIPIVGRLSVGPSLFALRSNDFKNQTSGQIPSREWLSYSLSKPLSSTPGVWDDYNQTGIDSNFSVSNRLWTHDSAAWFGFIPNGTRTFVVLGKSGMHNSGGGYKITQTNGNVCGGPCPYDPLDTSPYYWLYDLKDILSSGQSDTVLPYEFGEFNTRYVHSNGNGITGTVSGGAYDPASGKLLLLLKSATESTNQGSPIVAVYQLDKERVTTMIPMIDILLED